MNPPVPARERGCADTVSAERQAAAPFGEPAAEQQLHGWRRAVAFPLELLIRLYRILVSPLLGNVCRFYPTCSSYGLTAVRRYGLIRGSWLVGARLLRCHPWNPGGVDHVPLRGWDGKPMRHNEPSPGH